MTIKWDKDERDNRRDQIDQCQEKVDPKKNQQIEEEKRGKQPEKPKERK